MGRKKETGASVKKRLKPEIEHQLQMALGVWKEMLGDKNFEKRIKKAAKAFSRGLKVPAQEKDLGSLQRTSK